ncbi:phosphodiesterase [Nocardia thailandica]
MFIHAEDPRGPRRTAGSLDAARAALLDRPVRAAFRAGARLRGARVFHPRGIVLTGRFRPEDDDTLLGAGERPVVARLSKGLGAPGGLPDVLGLAFRLPGRDGGAWDVALATSGRGAVGRCLPTPARGWASARFGSLQPYRVDAGAPVWLSAEPVAADALPRDASVSDLRACARRGTLRFRLTCSGRHGRVLGELSLDAEASEPPRAFDPVRNSPAGIRLAPSSLTRVRANAYAGSRRGRGAGPLERRVPAAEQRA